MSYPITHRWREREVAHDCLKYSRPERRIEIPVEATIVPFAMV